NAELRFLADRQQGWMLVVFGTDGIGELLSLQNVFLAEQFPSLGLRRVGTDHLASKTFAVFLVGAAINRIHLHELAALVVPLFGLSDHREQQYGECDFQPHDYLSPGGNPPLW